MTDNKKPRINPYTSTSIGKDKVVTLTELQKYVKEVHGLSVTHQNIIDLAVEQAWNERSEFGKKLAELHQDPDMFAYLKLQAKLKAAGKL